MAVTKQVQPLCLDARFAGLMVAVAAAAAAASTEQASKQTGVPETKRCGLLLAGYVAYVVPVT